MYGMVVMASATATVSLPKLTDCSLSQLLQTKLQLTSSIYGQRGERDQNTLNDDKQI